MSDSAIADLIERACAEVEIAAKHSTADVIAVALAWRETNGLYFAKRVIHRLRQRAQ